jgi:hypothetical protein
MRSYTVIAVLAATFLAGSAARADDREWGEGSALEWSDVRPAAGYDVSVDVHGGVTVESFYGELSPYGDWVVVGNYGRVWRPRVAAGWRPYYYGRWEWTNEGWLWVSDEPWGWAAYHYGRWTHDPYYGWIWVPGVEWAPAWVSWRVSGDVIGWAPLAPGFSVYVSTYPFVDYWWTFVPCVRFASVPVYTAAFAPHVSRRHFFATAPAPARPPRPGRVVAAPSPAWGGPAPRLIEERVGRPVTPARIVAAPAPGARGRPGEIPVYRPETRVVSPPGGGRAGREQPALTAPPRNGRGTGAVAAPGWPGSGSGRGQEGGGSPPGRAGWQPEARGSGGAAPGHPSGAVQVPPARGGWRPEARGSGGGAPGNRSGAVQGPSVRGNGQPEAGGGGGAPGRRSGAVAAPPARGGGEGRGASGAPAPRGGGGGRGGAERGGGRGDRGGGRP